MHTDVLDSLGTYLHLARVTLLRLAELVHTLG